MRMLSSRKTSRPSTLLLLCLCSMSGCATHPAPNPQCYPPPPPKPVSRLPQQGELSEAVETFLTELGVTASSQPSSSAGKPSSPNAGP